jgi:hypothetical protein
VRHIADDPGAYLGRVVGNGQCVAYVREAARLGHTSTWRRGPHVRGSGAASGTAIATFDSRGGYANNTNGTSHAAILIEEGDTGLTVYDQWSGQSVHRRVIRFQGGAIPRWVNDGDRYYIIETNAPATA